MSNDKIEHTKPFDLNFAKAGAPYAQRRGLPARVIIYDRKCTSGFILIALLTCGDGIENIEALNSDGRLSHTHELPGDLVMLPLGYCEGKPVFVGDSLQNYDKTINTVKPCEHIFDGFKWPSTKPNLPAYSTWFLQCWNDVSVFKVIMKKRSEIEAYWKALDEYEATK